MTIDIHQAAISLTTGDTADTDGCLQHFPVINPYKHWIQTALMAEQTDSQTLNTFKSSVKQYLSRAQGRSNCLLFEYKLSLLYANNYNVFVMPEKGSLEGNPLCIAVWHGVVFVRYGIYKDGIFKFRIVFEQFPERPPSVVFTSEVYHPLVDWDTGRLDLGHSLGSSWSYGDEHLIFNVIEYSRLIFYEIQSYQNTKSLNQEAAQLFNTSKQEYFYRVRECVETSRQRLLINSQNTPFKFGPLSPQLQTLKKQVETISNNSELQLSDKKQILIQCLRDHQ